MLQQAMVLVEHREGPVGGVGCMAGCAGGAARLAAVARTVGLRVAAKVA